MAGASARYGLARWLPTAPAHFPWATFWTNLSGSLLLGAFLALAAARLPADSLVRPFVATGIIGAYTTMSTYEVETALLLRAGHPATAVLYGLGSVAAGLALAAVGLVGGRRLIRPRGALA